MPSLRQKLQEWFFFFGKSQPVDIETFFRKWETLSARILTENNRLRSLLEAMPVAVVIVNEAGRIVLINSQAEKGFGYTRSELLGEPVRLLFPELNYQTYLRMRVDSLSAPGAHPVGSGVDLYCQRKDGSLFPVEISLSPLEIEKKTLIINAISDISDLKKAQGSLGQLAADLEFKNRELESFAYSASHDLRAPLRSMETTCESLLAEYGNKLDEQGQDYLQRIRQSTRSMMQIIEDLLNLSRVSRSEIFKERVSLSDLADDIGMQLKKSQPERGVEFKIAPGLLVSADRRLIKIALENLLGNAWKFTGEQQKATIEVGATLVNNHRAFFIRDNGAGFNMAYANKMFQAFERLHTQKEFPGTGIGLATVERIIKRHEGKIWAEGKVGEGATFYFTLGEPPCVQQHHLKASGF